MATSTLVTLLGRLEAEQREVHLLSYGPETRSRDEDDFCSPLDVEGPITKVRGEDDPAASAGPLTEVRGEDDWTASVAGPKTRVRGEDISVSPGPKSGARKET